MVKREARLESGRQPVLRCSFCNKDQAEVRKLIAGPNVFICDECVQVCAGIIREENEATPTANEAAPTAAEPPSHSPSLHPTRVVICSLCGQRVLWEEALAVPERGFLCPGCSGEVEASLAQRREDVT
jgi:hypothetical protein